MSIKKYTSYFHDGSMLSIEQKSDSIALCMESAEVDPEEVNDIPLTSRDTIKGTLYFKKVKSVLVNEQAEKGNLGRFVDYEIMHLDISLSAATIELFSWGQKDDKSQDYATVFIEAEHIDWESASDLSDEIPQE